MIERNVVRVETIDKMGTGLIYPCSREKRRGYIVFTNRHVLEGISETERIDEQIQIVLYDDFGREVSNNKMKNWDFYWAKDSFEYQDDIAAIYLELDDDVVFHPETAVGLEELENRTKLYMEGYPGVMSNDDMNRRIQLEGVSKYLFPSNKYMGAYQITDDYHWYNSYSDYNILAGVSGSPVYYPNQGKNFILGINQSIANIDQGENPFKLVYYIKFKHILDYLRQKDCIIFSKVSECEFQIVWVKNKKEEGTNEIKLLLIGGSGSGKSSFVKSFAYNQNKIKGVGDGQTTRSDVCYSFSRVENNPTAKVFFLTQQKYISTMKAHIGTWPIRLVIAQALGISQHVVQDEKKFLILVHGIYEQFVELEEENSTKNGESQKTYAKGVLEDIKNLLFFDESVKNKTLKYEKILDHLLDWIPYYFMPCILDESWKNEHIALENVNDRDIMTFFGISSMENEDCSNNKIWKLLAKEVYEIIKTNNQKHFNVLQKELISYFYALYRMKGQAETGEIRKYRELCELLKGLGGERLVSIVHRDSHREFEARLRESDFQKRLLDSLLLVKGFFDAREFEFLLGKEWVEQIYTDKRSQLIRFREDEQEIVDDDEADEYEREVISEDVHGEFVQNENGYNQKEGNRGKKKGRKKDIVISKGMDEVLGCVYQKIMEKTKEKIKEEYSSYDGIQAIEKNGDTTSRANLCFKLDRMNENDILLLQKCLKVTKDGSFTGIIEKVLIQDKISDPYVSILDKLKINTLTIVDTCGLDHVTIWNEKDLKSQVERLYSEYVKQWDAVKQNQQNHMMETGILYIKKLDAGKPDELNAILPIVREIVPSTPMYCMFSGIDIFYRTEQEVNNIFWKKGVKNCPKAVRYILENNMGMTDIVDVNAYNVLRNNLFPFCGDEKLVYTKYVYYKNNVNSVRKLLTSIAMKEASSLEIIDQTFVEEVKDGKYDDKIKEIIYEMFDVASLHSRHEWWNTKRADIVSFFRDGNLGYKNTYDHKFYKLFHDGYLSAIRGKGGLLLETADGEEKDVKYAAAVKACLYNMENLFLGINENLVKTNVAEGEKNKFRQIIEHMYEGKKYNPFNSEYQEKLTDEYIQAHRDEIFDNVFGFRRYLDNEDKEIEGNDVLLEIVDFFKEQFLKQIEIDNSRKATYLVKMNETFVEELDNVKKEFCEKYGDNDIEAERMFETFMRYYFSSNRQE